jgi:dihydroflavonol-4-reductase
MHIAAAQKGRVGERYILGAANYKLADWFRLIAEIVGVASPRFPVPGWALPPLASLFDALRAAGLPLPVDGNQTRIGARDYFCDFSKGWNELGEPQIDMRQSVEDTYRWYLEHGYVKHDALARVIDWAGGVFR